MSLPAWCQSALLVATAATALAWLAGGLIYYGGTRRIRGLGSLEPLPDDKLPSLSIVAAARNEAVRIEPAARSLLAQDYPGLQVVAVDDRSEDATGATLDRIAAEDPRLRVVHVTELPEGWLGKCNALAVGEAAASGEWILFTDGDVTMEPDAVRRAVSLAIQEHADHVAVAADLEVGGLGEAIFLAYFVYAFNVSQRPWDAKNPRSGAHIGIGAFNLVRREAYERAGGHRRIRMELLDDMGLGLIVKKSGGVSLFAGHDGLVRARWQEGLGGLIVGVEKNAFAALRYDALATIGAVALQLALSWIPVVGLFAADPRTRAAAILAWSGVFLAYATTARVVETRTWHAITMPIGATLFGYSILASMAQALRRGGIVWRGTFYSLRDLRAGRVR
jgi:glycosyltransferase involved in cell wall biosynthesis